MIVDATISVAAIQAELERLGAVITWPQEAAPPVSRLVTVEAEVDEDDAANALPLGFWQGGEVDQDFADPRDVHDFIAACGRRDRSVAEALVGRVFVNPGNIDAAAHALRGVAS